SKKKEQAGLKADLEAEQKRLAKEKSTLEKEHAEAIGVSKNLEKKIAAEQSRLAAIAKKAEEERKRKEAAERAAAQKAAASNKSSNSSVTTYSAPVQNSS